MPRSARTSVLDALGPGRSPSHTLQLLRRLFRGSICGGPFELRLHFMREKTNLTLSFSLFKQVVQKQGDCALMGHVTVWKRI